MTLLTDAARSDHLRDADNDTRALVLDLQEKLDALQLGPSKVVQMALFAMVAKLFPKLMNGNEAENLVLIANLLTHIDETADTTNSS